VETYLNPSILWLSTIIYCKKLMTCIFKLTQFEFFSFKLFFCWCCCPFKLEKNGPQVFLKKKCSHYNHLILNTILCSNTNHTLIQMINYTTWKKSLYIYIYISSSSSSSSYLWCKNIFYFHFLCKNKSNIIWWKIGIK